MALVKVLFQSPSKTHQWVDTLLRAFSIQRWRVFWLICLIRNFYPARIPTFIPPIKRLAVRPVTAKSKLQLHLLLQLRLPHHIGDRARRGQYVILNPSEGFACGSWAWPVFAAAASPDIAVELRLQMP